MVKNEYFDQRLGCEASVRWSTNTTCGLQIQSRYCITEPPYADYESEWQQSVIKELSNLVKISLISKWFKLHLCFSLKMCKLFTCRWCPGVMKSFCMSCALLYREGCSYPTYMLTRSLTSVPQWRTLKSGLFLLSSVSYLWMTIHIFIIYLNILSHL